MAMEVMDITATTDMDIMDSIIRAMVDMGRMDTRGTRAIMGNFQYISVHYYSAISRKSLD